MTVTVCIGSYCHIKGSKAIIDIFEEQVRKRGLEGQVQIAGRFCTGNCAHSVCVGLDGEIYSVQPENAEKFFEEEIVTRL